MTRGARLVATAAALLAAWAGLLALADRGLDLLLPSIALPRGAVPTPEATSAADAPPVPPPSAAGPDDREPAPTADAGAHPEASAPRPTPAPAARGRLVVPVASVPAAAIGDTFADPRGGGRTHEGIDIMAPRGTPVVAAGPGRVVRLFRSVPGGLTVYQFDPTETWCYYYAHLDAWAPGLREGQVLRAGDLVGTVGASGNAAGRAPHLHFGIYRLGPQRRWWQGTPVDPLPWLRSTGR